MTLSAISLLILFLATSLSFLAGMQGAFASTEKESKWWWRVCVASVVVASICTLLYTFHTIYLVYDHIR